MSTLQETVHAEMVRYLVSKTITCPRTGQVLDVRTAVVLLDRDGDPAFVMSPQGWDQLTEAEVAKLTAAGYTVRS